jgi:hypothetical protein
MWLRWLLSAGIVMLGIGAVALADEARRAVSVVGLAGVGIFMPGMAWWSCWASAGLAVLSTASKSR